MINDIKLGMKVVRYGLSTTSSIAVTVLFLLLGFFMELFNPYVPLTGLYMGMGGMLLIQVICSFSVSTMVQTSVMKKRLQTSVPAILSGVYMFLIHTIFLVIKWIRCEIVTREIMQFAFWEVGNAILMNALMMVIIVVYGAAALKAFWPSTILFLVVYLGVYSVSSTQFLMDKTEAIAPIGVAVVLSYVILMIGALLVYWIYKALYKKDYSKLAFETALKRAK